MIPFMNQPQKIENLRATWGICLLLALATLVSYWGVFSAEFVDYDDPFYVVQNQHVQDGLTWDGLNWALTSRECDNWHPLTWISLMVDGSLYGAYPVGYHATNLALHIANTLLLFLLLQRLTGARWRSAFVAALFALHPLHVESVAWVSERKDVLSAFFALLTLRAYVWYVEKPVTDRYLPVLILFTLGLMAKPMLVTLPMVLLLLDFWPLRRVPAVVTLFGREFRIAAAEEKARFPLVPTIRLLVSEKIPLLALSAVSCLITIWAQTQAISMSYPLMDRLLNAALAYLRYLEKMVWPARLYVNYPYPHGWPIWFPLVAVIILVSLSIAAIRRAEKQPYFFMGWFWFLITLVPVIGLVQVGIQSMADRYAYFPLIGVFIIIAWLGGDLARQWHLPPTLLRVLAISVLAVCVPLTMIQVGYWKNSFTLYEHALRLNPDNYFVEINLAMVYKSQGQLESAREHLLKAVKINPRFGETYNKLGWVQFLLGQYSDAIESYQNALRFQGAPAMARYGLALAFEKQGKWSNASENIQAALALEPGNQEDIDEYNLIVEKSAKAGAIATPATVPPNQPDNGSSSH
jgi:tetratricopeptide (TPR) repeat protein